MEFETLYRSKVVMLSRLISPEASSFRFHIDTVLVRFRKS